MKGSAMRALLVLSMIGLSFLLTSKAMALNCEEAVTTRDMVVCAAQNLEQAEALLENHLNETKSSLDETALVLLSESQHSWQKFKTAECQRQRDLARGGTMAPLLEISCRETLTLRRLADLQSQEDIMIAHDDRVVWITGQNPTAPFTCEEDIEARIGLVPVYDFQQAKPDLQARLMIGLYSLDFPIDTQKQSALCGTNLTLEIVEHPNACPALRLEDGLCDPFLISWSKDKQLFEWQRN